MARDWLVKTKAKRAEITHLKVSTWLEKDAFPFIGNMPISAIGPRDVLDKVVRKAEARGAIDTAHRLKQLCGQVFRYAVVTGLAERDVTADLRAALVTKTKKNHAAITEPKQLGELRTMEWAELNLDGAEWRIPGRKMKMKVDPAMLDDTVDRVNISLPRRVLHRLDARARKAGESRSGFIAQLAVEGRGPTTTLQ